MKKLVVTFIAVVGLVSCAEQDKIVFVDRTKLLEEYQGRKDIQTKHDDKMEKLAFKKDSISKVLQMDGQEFDKKYKNLKQPTAAAQADYEALVTKQKNWSEILQRREYEINTETQKEVDTLLKTVKKFVNQFGKDKKYTYILGANDAGSVMYGDETRDVTEDVLKAINDDYAKN
ncbi:OmpH outer membrane protein [Neptunitalea chrysea]|uniref:OmpH outer membrane protein n=1 Tax=Neptunitalea chrysea TaxID=1647581 RepID=A0A9W6B5G5_9FLAO|nr:OmpH family outer membrane protein [Neptunitalea chrysea]GLB52915.1 OmpH outer membrane protein [Neptunitalea chrysea]